jgi:hypothetical protein
VPPGSADECKNPWGFVAVNMMLENISEEFDWQLLNGSKEASGMVFQKLVDS